MGEIRELIEKVDALHHLGTEIGEEVRKLANAQEEILERLEEIGNAVKENTAKLDHALPLLTDVELRQAGQWAR